MKKLLLLAILFAHSASATDGSLFDCRQIEGTEERVSCYDRIVDSQLPVRQSKKEVVENTRVDGSTGEDAPPSVPDALSLFGKQDAEAKRMVQKSLAIKEIDQIKATVSSVKRSAYKKLTVTLDNGQVWQQLDNEPLPLSTGDLITVRLAKLGSYLLKKQSGSGSIRVKRLN
jgi:hypothetical protein